MNLVDRAGRRIFYIYSSIVSGLGHVVFALYLYYLADNHAFDMAPMICLSFILFVSCLGMTPVPYLVSIEIFPKKVYNGSIIDQSFPNNYIFFSLSRFFRSKNADQAIRLFELHIPHAGQWILFNRTVSAAEGDHWTLRMDYILRCDVFLQRIVRYVCFAWNSRKILRTNYANIRQIKYWILTREKHINYCSVLAKNWFKWSFGDTKIWTSQVSRK